MRKLEWKKQARKDFLKIAEYIAQASPDSADRLVDEIESKVEGLPHHPELYRIGRKPGTREMVTHPNYLVIYRVKTTVVEILRLKHAARKWPSK